MINTEELKREIGKKLKRAREDKGLSQEDVAKQIGLSKVGYGAFERGSNLIALNYLLELSRILQKPITHFLPRHALTEIELNDLTHDPRVQDILNIWRFLTEIGHEPGLDALHKLALAFRTTYEEKRKPPDED